MTASTLLLRPYAAADHSACLSVFSSNVPRYFAVEELDEFDAFLAHPDASFLVAESGGRVVGCGGSYVREGVGRLCWGMVMQTEHRQAIGTALLVRRLGQLFAQAAVDEVALDTSQHSAGFFRRFGFRTTKVTTDGFAPGIDEVSMTLNRDDWSKLTAHHLAQLNIGVIKAAMDTPVMADFANNLDRINAVAEQSPGFVWRLQTEEGDATAIRPFGDNENMLVNMSVWCDVASLNHYVYSSAHVELMRRRREWFEPMREAFLVLWWVPAGHRPTVEEAIARLELLRAQGPTAEAFTFRKAFPSPDAPSAAAPVVFEDECPAA